MNYPSSTTGRRMFLKASTAAFGAMLVQPSLSMAKIVGPATAVHGSDRLEKSMTGIVVLGIGGAGGNAIDNMLLSRLDGADFVVANTDPHELSNSRSTTRILLGAGITGKLGAGSSPDIGRIAAEESIGTIFARIGSAKVLVIAAGMGGRTGSGAVPVIARAAREQGILAIGVVTKPFLHEGVQRMRIAEAGIEELSRSVDSLIVIPNQNQSRNISDPASFSDAFTMIDAVLHSAVSCVTELLAMPGSINLGYDDIRTVISGGGYAIVGTGEAGGNERAIDAAEAAIVNPRMEISSMKGAKRVLMSIRGGHDMTLFEIDAAANRIRTEADPEANIIFNSALDENLNGKMRVSVIATGLPS